MHHPVGKIIDAHIHNAVPRQVHYTQEVLFMRKGRLRVDFYDESGTIWCYVPLYIRALFHAHF